MDAAAAQGRNATKVEMKEKLVFSGFAFKFPVIVMKNAVIANQCAHWCGNPLVEWNLVTITTKKRNVSHTVG